MLINELSEYREFEGIKGNNVYCLIDLVGQEHTLKRDLLKAIFPEKLSIDVHNRKVRTTYINSLLYTSGSEAKDYESIEMKKGQVLTTCPFSRVEDGI